MLLVLQTLFPKTFHVVAEMLVWLVLLALAVVIVVGTAMSILIPLGWLEVRVESMMTEAQRLAAAFRRAHPSEIDDSECRICLEPFDSESHRPIELPCGHCFFQPCKERLFPSLDESDSSDKYRCPFCRRKLVDERSLQYSIRRRNMASAVFQDDLNSCALEEEMKRFFRVHEGAGMVICCLVGVLWILESLELMVIFLIWALLLLDLGLKRIHREINIAAKRLNAGEE